MKFVEFYNKTKHKKFGFSKVFLSKREILTKTQKFFGKNFAVCKKVRNFVSEINCKFNRI